MNLLNMINTRVKGVFHSAENRDWKLIFISRAHVFRDWQWGKIHVTDRMFCLADENNGCIDDDDEYTNAAAAAAAFGMTVSAARM